MIKYLDRKFRDMRLHTRKLIASVLLLLLIMKPSKRKKTSKMIIQQCQKLVRDNFLGKIESITTLERQEATLWLVTKVLEDQLEGNLIETGVLGGGNKCMIVHIQLLSRRMLIEEVQF